MDSRIFDFLISLAFSIPFWLALLVCIVVCLTLLGRHPRPALFAAAGFALLMVTRVVAILLEFFVVPEFASHTGDYMLSYRLVGFGESLFWAIGLILILLGVVMGRTPSKTVAPPLPQ
jgi:hypothetical protein